jgi:hypothetical protein
MLTLQDLFLVSSKEGEKQAIPVFHFTWWDWDQEN